MAFNKNSYYPVYLEDGLWTFKNKKTGQFYNEKFKNIALAQGFLMCDYQGEFYKVQLNDGKWALIDLTTQKVYDARFDDKDFEIEDVFEKESDTKESERDL